MHASTCLRVDIKPTKCLKMVLICEKDGGSSVV